MMTKLLPNERLDDLADQRIRDHPEVRDGSVLEWMRCFSSICKCKKARKKHWISEQEREFFRSFWKQISGPALYRTGDPGGECRYGKAQRQP